VRLLPIPIGADAARRAIGDADGHPHDGRRSAPPIMRMKQPVVAGEQARRSSRRLSAATLCR
jgi:hypothetical protein